MDILQSAGIGLAIGMLAGTTGTHGSARGRMTLLAAAIGLAAGFVVHGVVGALFCMLGGAVGCLVISDVVFGASRRQGGAAGALGFIVALAALLVVAVALLVPVLVLLLALALGWLGVARHRRAQRKHAGLRILR